MIRTILKNEETQIVEKKSKFIANIYRVDSEEEAKRIREQIEKKYFDAKHNCYAYVIEQNNEEGKLTTKLEKSSDNGEPQGTAGAQILECIKRNNLSNVIIIVTRYFGGILLGTGGLSRAYTEAANSVIHKIEIVEKFVGDEYEIQCSYENQKDINYILKQLKIETKKQEFLENVKTTIDVPVEKEVELNSRVDELKKQGNNINIEIKKRNILI